LKAPYIASQITYKYRSAKTQGRATYDHAIQVIKEYWRQMINYRELYSEYDLTSARGTTLKKPAAHQAVALNYLIKWYKSNPKPHPGGFLVLPTGGGKTFVAIRFLCLTALSDGYKVLWLAHTHHLLDQAYHSFEAHVGIIAEPKTSLKLRVVSGGIGYFHVADITPEDDVVIATLQTITKAYKEDHTALRDFIESAKGKLFVVFDEAHHAPAPSYRRLILNLRDRCDQMYLLGLTATPVYTDERKEGWLSKLLLCNIKSAKLDNVYGVFLWRHFY
jgi:superfamily II DNA or RNA helicase